MIKLHLAFLVIENKITIEQAYNILEKIGDKKLPEKIEDIISELKNIGL